MLCFHPAVKKTVTANAATRINAKIVTVRTALVKVDVSRKIVKNATEMETAQSAGEIRIKSAVTAPAVIRSGLKRHILQSTNLALLYVIQLGVME
jgi:hypothetical protein